jgi:hypothetical protein
MSDFENTNVIAVDPAVVVAMPLPVRFIYLEYDAEHGYPENRWRTRFAIVYPNGEATFIGSGEFSMMGADFSAYLYADEGLRTPEAQKLQDILDDDSIPLTEDDIKRIDAQLVAMEAAGTEWLVKPDSSNENADGDLLETLDSVSYTIRELMEVATASDYGTPVVSGDDIFKGWKAN